MRFKKNSLINCGLILFLSFLLITQICNAEEKYINLGASDDANADLTNTEIRIGQYWSGLDRYKESLTAWYPYVDLTDLPESDQYTNMQMVRGLQAGQFWVNANGFGIVNNQNRDHLFLIIRYKDVNFDPALDRFYGSSWDSTEENGVGVYGCYTDEFGDSFNQVKLGTLGGKHDYQWKTKSLTIPPNTLPVLDGNFVFQFSRAFYGLSDLYGELYVDWIRLSDESHGMPQGVATNEDYHISTGYWPEMNMNQNFTELSRTGFSKGNNPYFPIGLMLITSHHYWQDGNNNYLQNARDMGFNLVFYNGWEAHSSYGGWYWGDKDITTTGNYRMEENGDEVEIPLRYLGLPNFMDLAADYDLDVVPWFTTDMWRYYTRAVGSEGPSSSHYGYPDSSYNGTFPGMAESFRKVVQNNKNHPQLYMWMIKDEADHLDEYWGSPVESVRTVYQVVNQEDGDHPCLVNNMGWRPMMFRHYKDTFDVGTFDRYVRNFEGQASYSNIAEWAEEFKYQTDGEKPFLAIIESERITQNNIQVFTPVRHIRINSYLSLIHGAHGILYFDDPGPNTDLSVYNGCGSDCGTLWWDDFKKVLDEINDLAYTALHHSNADTVGYSYATSRNRDIYPIDHTQWGEGTTTNQQIHAVFRKNYITDNKYLITANAFGDTENPVFTIAGLQAGTDITVMFENRTITADDGQFTDAFDGGQTHVYYFPSTSITPVLAKPSNLIVTGESASQISLGWQDNSNGETGFQIVRSQYIDSGFIEAGTVGAGVQTFTDNNLIPDTRYYYRVRAFNTNTQSFYSKKVASDTEPFVIITPSNLAATTVSDTQINLSWQNNADNQQGIKIERSTSANSMYSTIASVNSPGNTYENSDLEPGTTYYYRIRAFNGEYYSNYSSTVEVATTGGEGGGGSGSGGGGCFIGILGISNN